MTTPRRESGTVRQLGTINNILGSRSLTHTSRRPPSNSSPRNDRQSCYDRNVRPRAVRTEQPQPMNHDSQETFAQQNQNILHTSQKPSHKRLGRSIQNVRNSGKTYRHASPPPQQRRGSGEGVHSVANAMQNHHSTVAVSEGRDQSFNTADSSSGKRKRKVVDDLNDTECDQPRKKHEAAYLNVKQAIRPSPGRAVGVVLPTKQKTPSTATAAVNNSRRLAAKQPLRLPSSPASNATPDRAHGTKKEPEVKPTPEEKKRNNHKLRPSASAVNTQGTKRRREGLDPIEEQQKRLCQTKTVKPLRMQRATPIECLESTIASSEAAKTTVLHESEYSSSVRITPTREPPVRTVRAQAVRPESSFAPVTPNHECDLKFLEYSNDSVPVLFSAMIQHTRDDTLLNKPPGKLILDALTTIEASSRANTRGVRPFGLELTGSMPGRANPTKVLDDIDLYLHQSNGKLHVATDRGLVAISDYLQLIGVPEMQSIRVEGCIPPWAKAALRSCNKRRVVQLWGEDRFVKKDMPLEKHQVAMSSIDHMEEWEEWSEKATVDRTSSSASFSKIEDKSMLEAEPGDLPLPLGSTVIVYNIDDDDVWAYGQLSGTDKRGRFPISHTCPMDWSLDRFACTDNSLNEPLPESTDPTELDWKGPFHWIKQKGFLEGPTWKESVAKSAAKAIAEKERRISTQKTKANASIVPALSTESNEVSKAQLEVENIPHNMSSLPKAPGTTATMSQATKSVALSTSLQPATTDSADPNNTKNTEPLESPGIPTIICAEDVLGAVTESSITLATTQARKEPKESEAIIMSKDRVLEEGLLDDARKPQEPEEPEEPEGSQKSGEPQKSEEPEPQPEEPESAEPESAEPEPEEPEPAESEPVGRKQTVKANVGGAIVVPNPFSKPRYDPFARNDDIEYDWGDSDDEL